MNNTVPFTGIDLSFIQEARPSEVEAIEGGRGACEFSSSPLSSLDENDQPVGGVPVDDIQEVEERVAGLQKYVFHATAAFRERGLEYPFQISANQISLEILPGRKPLAASCAELSEAVGNGDKTAKEFEARAFRALHRLIGGWAVCVGTPRLKGTGPKRAVAEFRKLLRATECGDYENPKPPPNGDYGMDGVYILGREWGGPMVFLQAKNSEFDRKRFAAGLVGVSDSLYEWFGKRVDRYRSVLSVFAMNTVLTLQIKELAFQACSGGFGYHVLDCVDILLAETLESTDVSEKQVPLSL